MERRRIKTSDEREIYVVGFALTFDTCVLCVDIGNGIESLIFAAATAAAVIIVVVVVFIIIHSMRNACRAMSR